MTGPDRCLLSRTQNGLQCFTRLVARSAIETTIVFFLQMHFASEFHLNLPFCPSHPFRFCSLTTEKKFQPPQILQKKIPTAANLTASNEPIWKMSRCTMRRRFAALRPNSMASPLEPATTSCFAASVALLAPGFASQWRLSLPRARGSEWRESESQASAVASLFAPS